LFSIIVPSYIPTRSAQEFLFFHILPTFSMVKFFNVRYYSKCIVISHDFILLINDFEYLLICLFATCVLSLIIYLFRHYAHLKIDFLMLSFENCLCSLDTSPLSEIGLTNIFSHLADRLLLFFQDSLTMYPRLASNSKSFSFPSAGIIGIYYQAHLTFHFLNDILLSTTVFDFYIFQFTFCFITYTFDFISKNTANPRS
jgi:hypothetical protein